MIIERNALVFGLSWLIKKSDGRMGMDGMLKFKNRSE